MPRVAVVGGGVSGLAAAYRLRALLGPDAELTVIEGTDRIGGKLRTVELAGLPYDVGAEAFLARRPEAIALIRELGLDAELTHPTPAGAKIRAGGESRPIPPGTVLGVPVSADAVRDVLSAEGYRRVAAEPELPPADLAGRDVAVGPLLRERFGSEVTERLVDPLLGGVYAGHSDSLGLRATMPALAARLDAGAGSLLSAAASLAPKASPTPVSAPTPAGPAAPTRAPVFGTLRQGLGTLPESLAEAAKADLRLGQPVRGLQRTATGWRLEIGSANEPEFLQADAVVLAVPAPAASKLLAEHAPAAAANLAKIELASMAVVAFALPLDCGLPEQSGVLIGSGERRADGTPFTAKGFTFSSRKWAHLAGDHLLVRGSAGRAGEANTLHRTDAELIAAVRADLAELTGVTAEPVDSLVVRWGGGLPQYGVGHLDLIADIERAVAGLPGIAVAGAVFQGVGVPGCLASADAAAGRIASQLAHSPD